MQKARGYLLLATAAWALSFPLTKALRGQFYCDTGASELSQTAAFVFIRFTTVFLLFPLLLFFWKSKDKFGKKEFFMGMGLGVSGGLGLLFQADGLAYTEPGVSAFLTQSTCIFVPLVALLRKRKKMTFLFAAAFGAGILGIYFISGLDLREFKMGRGEAETLLAAVFFTFQILLLEGRWKQHVGPYATGWMFFFFAAVNIPFFSFSHLCLGTVGTLLEPSSLISLMLVLVGVCTLLPFILMNIWQPRISSTEATYIYSLEAVFALFFGFVTIPLLIDLGARGLSQEYITWPFALGATLLLGANFFLFVEAKLIARKSAWKT